MHTVTPVTFEFSGVERELRSTIGAHQMIEEHFGCGVNQALKEHGAKALVYVAFAFLHDADGNPPAGITEKSIAFSISLDQFPALAAAVMSAITQGKASKNELEALIVAALEKELESKTGSHSGPSVLSVSESATGISGGDIESATSSQESSNSNSPSELGIIDSELSLQLS